MVRAVDGLEIKPGMALVDGNRLPPLSIPARAIVKGDATVPVISAASILAKVARDEALIALHELYPQYGFDKHKGYLTAAHMDALKKFGPSPVHRRTYEPIRALLATENKIVQQTLF
jgi:ribonuclease HII